MDPLTALDGGFESLPALISAVVVLIGVWLVLDRMVALGFGAADVIRGRDRCHYCGSELPSREGLGHEPRCRSCERKQPWA